MFLRLICAYFTICIFAQVKSTLHFGSYQRDSFVQPSILSDLCKTKAELVDHVKFNIHQNLNYGAGVISDNLNNLKNSISTSIDATGRLIDSGIAAGKQYGRAVFHSAIIVPKTVHDLVSACISHKAYIHANAAETLSYVDGEPLYLFQFVDEMGNIIPITAAVAATLVPGLSI